MSSETSKFPVNMESKAYNDLSSIKDEDILRRMWQQAEDFGRKREIRAHMYKLRENRLREFYATETNMDSFSDIGITKTPLTPSHGDCLTDQSFQSFKTKEIRDSESPTQELKYSTNGVVVPDISGWNIVKSSETSKDGKTHKTASLATTEGTNKIPGGHSEFSGHNEHLTKISHDGDENNYTKTSDESSTTHLEEKSVFGDEKNGHIETKNSSIVSSSNSVTSQHCSSGNQAVYDHQKILNEFDDLLESAEATTKSFKKRHEESKSIHQEEGYNKKIQEPHKYLQNDRLRNEDHILTSKSLINQSEELMSSTSTTQKEEAILTKREADYYAAAPGKIISKTVDYPDPNTKLITEIKSLPDGTTVTTRKYETKAASSKTWKTASSNEKCSSTRTIIEDHGERNRVEYILDGTNHIVTNETNGNNVQRRLSKERIDNQETRNFNLNDKTETTKTESNSNKSTKKYLTTNCLDENKIINENFIETERTDQVQERKTKEEIIENSSTNYQVEKAKNETTYKLCDEYPSQRYDHTPSRFNQQSEHELINHTTEKDFTTQGFPSTRDFSTETSTKNIVKKSIESHTSEQQLKSENSIEISREHSKQHRNKINNKKISVEVDAAHDAFAKSLRSASPVSDYGHHKSNRNSVSPEKRSNRSPSHDSVTFSETSHITSSTITKETKNNQPKSSHSRRQNSNETNDMNYKQKESNKFSSKNPKNEPIYGVPKSNRRVHSKSPESSPERHNKPTERFTKTINIENSLLRDNLEITKDTLSKKKPNEKPLSEDEGFEPESSRSGSPLPSDYEYTENIDIRIQEHNSNHTKTSQKSSLKKIKDDLNQSEQPFYNGSQQDRQPKPEKLYDNKNPDKERPTLMRSETYEERCRKILGMDETIENIKTTANHTNEFIETEKSEEIMNRRTNETMKNTSKPRSPSLSPSRRDNFSNIKPFELDSPTETVYFVPKSKTKQESPLNSEHETSPLRRSTSKENMTFSKSGMTSSTQEQNVQTKISLKKNQHEKNSYNEERLISPIQRSSCLTSTQKTSKEDLFDSSFHTEKTYSNKAASVTSKTSSNKSNTSSPDRNPLPKSHPSQSCYRSPEISPSQKIKQSPDKIIKEKSTKTSNSRKVLTSEKFLNNNNKIETQNSLPLKSVSSPSENPTRKFSTIDQKNTDISNTHGKQNNSVSAKDSFRKEANIDQPKHITVAKINLSPIPSRKTINTDTQRSSKIAETKNYVNTKRDDTNKALKPTQRFPLRSINDKTTSEQRKLNDRKSLKTEFVAEQTTKQTPRKVSSKKLPITERKESAPIQRSNDCEKDISQKMTRSTSENLIKVIKTSSPRTKTEIDAPKLKHPFKKLSMAQKTSKSNQPSNNCSTTKTINIDSEDMDDIVVEVREVKRTHEKSTKDIVPEACNVEDTTPRYPDKVFEPEDEPHSKPKVKNIPIFEEESNSYTSCHITEVRDDSIERSMEETEEVDECRLSVQDKVSKFITTAEEIQKPRASAPFKPDPRPIEPIDYDDCLLSVNDKVNKFRLTAESITTQPKQNNMPYTKEINKDIMVDSFIRNDSEKVNKFINTTEKLQTSSPQRSPELVAKIEREVSKQKSHSSNLSVDDITTHQFEPEQNPQSKPKLHITDRYVPQQTKIEKISPAISLRSTDAIRKAKSVFENGSSSISKQSDILSRPSVWEGRREKADVKLQDIGIYQAKENETNSLHKNKLLDNSFENQEYEKTFQKSSWSDDREQNKITEQSFSSCDTQEARRSPRISPEQCYPSGPHTPLSYRRSSFQSNDNMTEVRTEKTDTKQRPQSRLTQNLDDSVSIKRNLFEKSEEKNEIRENSSKPSYMDHTLSSIEHRKDSQITNKNSQTNSFTSSSPIKFGVELKRTDSRDSTSRRKSSSSEIPHVEEIFDLNLLERMLETVVGYEQRRRIRAQIRLVKKMQDPNNKSTEVSLNKNKTLSSRGQPLSTERQTSSSNQFIEIKSKSVSETKEPKKEGRNVSPRRATKTAISNIISHESKSKDTSDGKPVWANKNILKKVSENSRTMKTTFKAQHKTTSNKIHKEKNVKDENCIISSYGIGPTDENGKPLFGIKALRKQTQPSENTKVSGTIISEQYYSENDMEPVGKRQVTVYSNNPADVEKLTINLDHCTRHEKNGITTLTQTEEIGRHNGIQGKNNPAIEDTFTTTQEPKLSRKGSVKEISEKFIRKDSSSSITEKTAIYPKAGLILRTQTHHGSRSSTPGGNSTRSGSLDYDENVDDYESDFHSMSNKHTQMHTQIITENESENDSMKQNHNRMISSSSSSRSFLNSQGSKVTDVNDVLERMRNADNVFEDGDTIDDQEARSLLNKFLGASVLMSGMESMAVDSSTKSKSVHTTKQYETKTTTAVKKDSFSPVSHKTVDIEEICDKEKLKKLLDQANNYEDRRKIRTRLRKLMAEQEACADIVTNVTAELQKDLKLKDKTVERTTNKSFNSTSNQQSESDTSEYEEVEEYIEEELEDIKDEAASEENENNVANEKSLKNLKCQESENQKMSQEKELNTSEKTETKKEEETILTKNTKVTSRTTAAAPKPLSPFAKFRQLDKQNSTKSTPNSPLTPSTPGDTKKSTPLFKFTDPALSARAATVKEQLLQWCQMKTKEYENIQINNFSSSWSDGLAFCALIHHFLPDAFDYSKLTPEERRHNFELAFRVADEKAGIAPLLDVEDMVIMKRPDWKCVFTYVQTIYRRFRNSN